MTLRKNTNPVYGQEFSASGLEVKVYESYENISNLTIFRTIQEDEGMYHCAVMDWSKITWSATYLSLKGNNVILLYFGITLTSYCVKSLLLRTIFNSMSY